LPPPSANATSLSLLPPPADAAPPFAAAISSLLRRHAPPRCQRAVDAASSTRACANADMRVMPRYGAAPLAPPASLFSFDAVTRHFAVDIAPKKMRALCHPRSVRRYEHAGGTGDADALHYARGAAQQFRAADSVASSAKRCRSAAAAPAVDCHAVTDAAAAPRQDGDSSALC